MVCLTALVLAVAVHVAIHQYTWKFVSYPIELEWREGTYWLHALAQSHGVNIFKNDDLAYVMATHGIVDHLVKAGLHGVFRSWEPQYILRFFVVAFPVLSLLAIFVQSRGKMQAAEALISALCLNGALQVALHDIGHWNTLIGRSDPTAFALLAGAYLFYRPDPTSFTSRASRHVSCLAIALLLSTNWKWYPVALIIPVIMEQRRPTLPIREFVRLYLVIAGYTVASCGLFFLVWFQADAPLYFRYFFGLFFGNSPYAGSSAPFATVIHYVRTPAIPLLVVLSILPVFVEAWRHWVRRSGDWPKTLAAVATLASLFVSVLALKMNFMAGGYWYLCPQVIILVIYYGTRYRIGPGLAAVILMFGLVVLWRSDNLPLMKWYDAQLTESLPAARSYTRKLILLDEAFGIYSEEAHLFRRSRRLPPVDMGDGSENVARVNYFGSRHSAIVERETARIRSGERVLVFVGPCASSACKALAADPQYYPWLTSPAPAIGGRVYVRIDHLEEMQRFLADHAANQ